METIQVQLQAKYKRFLISQKEACDELGITLNTLMKLRKTGEIKTKKVAGRIYVNILDLAAYLSETE